MKDWSDLEEKYQEMREKDPASAEDFKKKMTERFQKTVQVRPLKILLEPLKNTVLPKQSSLPDYLFGVLLEYRRPMKLLNLTN